MKMIGHDSDWLFYTGRAFIKVADPEGSSLSYTHYANFSVLIKFSQKTSVFTLISISDLKNRMFWMCIRIASVRRF